MKKKRVIIKSSIKYLLLATIMLSVLSFSPVSFNYAGPSVALAQSPSAIRIKTEDHKEIQSRYRDSLHAVKAEYKKTRENAWVVLKSNLEKAENKEERIEAKKEYRSAIKAAKEKLNTTLKELKFEFRTKA